MRPSTQSTEARVWGSGLTLYRDCIPEGWRLNLASPGSTPDRAVRAIRGRRASEEGVRGVGVSRLGPNAGGRAGDLHAAPWRLSLLGDTAAVSSV